MSGPKSAGYTLSADRLAQLHAQREAERQRALEAARLRVAQERWRAVALRHHELRRRAARLAGMHATTVRVDELPAPGSTSVDVENTTRAVLALISRLDQELAEQERAARDTTTRDAVRTVLGDLAAAAGRPERVRRRPVAATAPDTSRDDDIARYRRLMGRLDPEVAPPPELTGAADELRAEGTRAEARRAVLARVQSTVDTLNCACAARRQHAAARAEAEAAQEQTGDAELRVALDAGADTAALQAATAAAIRRDDARREDTFVEEIVLEVLRHAGFTVTASFSVHTPQQGVLVRRDRDPATHGVQVRVGSGSVDVEAVRLRSGGGRTPADLHAEEELCAVAPQVWQALNERGVRVREVRAMPAGVVVPREVTTKPAAPKAVSEVAPEAVSTIGSTTGSATGSTAAPPADAADRKPAPPRIVRKPRERRLGG